jgi:phosphopantetheinyl transferase (holo-ACP synthase)
VDIRVTSKGPTFEQVTRAIVRDVESATRKVGRDVATIGRKAIASGEATFRGKKLTASTKQHVSGTRSTIIFHAKPAGAWAIRESGAKAHDIKPKRAQALHVPGFGRKESGFMMVVHHRGATGSHRWTAAGVRLEDAVEKPIENVYDKAFT